MQEQNSHPASATPHAQLPLARLLQVMRGWMQRTAALYMNAASHAEDHELRGLLHGLGTARSIAALEMTDSLAASAARKRMPHDVAELCPAELSGESIAAAEVGPVLEVCEAREQYLMDQLDGILEEFELGDMSRAALVGQRMLTLRLLSRTQRLHQARVA